MTDPLMTGMKTEDIEEPNGCKKCAQNRWGYVFGEVTTSNCWYTEFLQEGEVCDRTRVEAKIKTSEFRSYFQLTLETVEELVDLFLSNGCISHRKACMDDGKHRIKAELLILAILSFSSLECRSIPSPKEANTYICDITPAFLSCLSGQDVFC